VDHNVMLFAAARASLPKSGTSGQSIFRPDLRPLVQALVLVVSPIMPTLGAWFFYTNHDVAARSDRQGPSNRPLLLGPTSQSRLVGAVSITLLWCWFDYSIAVQCLASPPLAQLYFPWALAALTVVVSPILPVISFAHYVRRRSARSGREIGNS
jgi:hypothetical protein